MTLDLDCRAGEWACSPILDAAAFDHIRRRLILDYCLWDPQVGDGGTLADFALVLPLGVWRQLAWLAEQLTRETMEAEQELLDRPELLGELGLPRTIRRILVDGCGPPITGAAARVMRFDFHPTPDGWRISEVNSDVPGGYTEASNLPRLLAESVPGARPAGDPAARLADALAKCSKYGQIGLLAAPGYMEDQQIIAYLAALLRERGCETHRAHPGQVRWSQGSAHLESAWYRGPLDAILRFYQGEWLSQLPFRCGWSHFFRGGRTPLCNPGFALLVESKRWPLVWDRLDTPLPTWRSLLPETCDPRTVPWRRDPTWLLKTALCNTGDTVAIRNVAERQQWREAAWSARFWPRHWVAQRRFDVLPLPTPRGNMYACLGVYTVNETPVGVYGRISPRPLIDFAAVNVAVLIRELWPEEPTDG
jgi:glutathionylspermidine synthase